MDGFLVLAVSLSTTVKQPSMSSVTVRVGKRPAGDSVKAIKPPLTWFVGRLDPKTTVYYLDEVGIKDAVCWNLQAKDGRVFKTAAFRVSCCDNFWDLFSEGAELRDSVYRRRVPAAWRDMIECTDRPICSTSTWWWQFLWILLCLSLSVLLVLVTITGHYWMLEVFLKS